MRPRRPWIFKSELHELTWEPSAWRSIAQTLGQLPIGRSTPFQKRGHTAFKYGTGAPSSPDSQTPRNRERLILRLQALIEAFLCHVALGCTFAKQVAWLPCRRT